MHSCFATLIQYPASFRDSLGARLSVRHFRPFSYFIAHRCRSTQRAYIVDRNEIIIIIAETDLNEWHALLRPSITININEWIFRSLHLRRCSDVPMFLCAPTFAPSDRQPHRRIYVLIWFSFCCQQKSDRNQRVAKVISFIVRSRSKNKRDFYWRSLVGCICTRKCVFWIYCGRYVLCHRRIYFTIDRVGGCLCEFWHLRLSTRFAHIFENLLFWWSFAVFSLLCMICLFVFLFIFPFQQSLEHWKTGKYWTSNGSSLYRSGAVHHQFAIDYGAWAYKVSDFISLSEVFVTHSHRTKKKM